MERLFEYLKRSLTIARKTIFFNFKQYAFFFVAILIVQMFYGAMTISYFNNNEVEEASAKEEYNYDVMLAHLNETQFGHVQSYAGSMFEGDKYYKIIEGDTPYTDDYGDHYYDIKLIFTRTDKVGNKGEELIGVAEKEEYLAKFKATYYDPASDTGSLKNIDSKNTFYFYSTPVMDITTNMAANGATYWLISAILLALSVFLMISLYNIRVNQNKYMYGVYMTYGADFKKLFSTAFWEMFMISVITWLPSVALSTVLVFLMYRPSGFAFKFNPVVFLMVFVFSLVVVLISVFFPMRLMAIKAPMSLIVTEDNSNLVSSPKNSINVFMKKFPFKYELYSSWRFRKYNLSTVVTSIVFCAFFIMGLYLANIYTTDLEYKRPDFVIDLEESYESKLTEEMKSEIMALDGVEAVSVSGNSVDASRVPSHVLMDKSNVNLINFSMVSYGGKDYKGKDAGRMRATSNVIYNAMTPEQVDMLMSFYGGKDGKSIKGDLSSVLTDSHTVAVGNSLNNITSFDFDIGDTIYVAVRTKGGKITDGLSGAALLREQIEKDKYTYEAFTIGAVLEDIPCGDLPIYFSEADYTTVTKTEPDAMLLNIYIDQNMALVAEDGQRTVNDLDNELRAWAHEYGNVDVKNTYQISKNNVAYDKHYNELYVVISIMLLVISPIMWFFSQSLYYTKRELEFNILQALGAKVKEIRQIYVQGGLIMAGLSLVVSFVFSYLGSYLLFLAYNVMLPYFNGENVRYAFYMPWYALVTSVVISVACGFLSAYLPYRSYYKHRFTLVNGGAGESED